MSGLESAALVGGRVLGPLAAKAASALARKVLFKYKVSRRVRKRVDFACSWGTYRAWLKTLTLKELSTPVEDVAAALAVRLDNFLSGKSKEWPSADDHLSRALRLVKLTYPAIAAELGDADRAETIAAWDQKRSAQLLELLLQLVGPEAALNSEDLAAVLQRRSAARRTVRLQPFDLDEAALRSYFDRITSPDVPEGQVVVLLGDYGAGKTEIAESWHRAAIRELDKTDTAPLPVWLYARDLAGLTMEGAVDRQVGTIWRRGRGACIVVDGLDEADRAAAAQAILESAQVLSRSHAGVRVLLTARPGVLSPTDREKVEAPLLSEAEALELVELTSGEPQAAWQWTAGMRMTVRRPFFALAAGSMLGGDHAPRGEADLIRTLVENSLEKAAERSAVTSAETRLVLTNLAISLTRSGRAELSFSDRQVARSSRLVADDPGGQVSFSLPIFQHWFAAQAILDGTVSPAHVVADAASFNRWRWAAAVAALSASTPDAVDDLLSAWVAGNAGACAWIIKEAFSAHRTWRSEDDVPLDPATSRTRLLRSLRGWADGLGPLAEGVLPHRVVNGPVGLGVAVSGHQLGVGLASVPPASDYVTTLPSQIDPSARNDGTGWRLWFAGPAPEGGAWPWTVIRDRIAGRTIDKLSEDRQLGAPNGIWSQEQRFDVARRVAERRSPFGGDLAADDVRSASVKLLDRVAWNPKSRFSFGGSAVVGTELLDLVSWIDSTGATQIKSHLPESDVTHPPSGWVWDLYSPERLMAFEVEVYGRACEAYDEALAHTFGRLGWSMPRSALQPVGVILELSYREDSNDGGRFPGLTVVPVPMPLIGQLAPSGTGAVWSTSGRAVISQIAPEQMDDWERHSGTLETVATWLAQQDREASALGWTRSVVDDMSNARPSSNVAANWLASDLRSLGLGTGTLRLR
ncbi:NACHT domain-containing protein [Promicromonospora sp. MS192]|uniref:NACHT domain-containing protein n=1 Tax=Promicromonospora sp. MS192 TaxID=3412684 RepID=UPI003C2CAF91